MADTVRAKFRCLSMKVTQEKPGPVQRSQNGETQTVLQWPREFEFSAQYDMSVPEDQRYSLATPYAVLKMQVDNPAVEFHPGRTYRMEITEVPE